MSDEPITTDIIIVGAGLSGIGAACHLSEKCPSKRFLILEGRQAIGGTWDLFRYPGIRSDSDMHTFGYRFKPWLEAKAIADGPSILKYIADTAAEYRLESSIRYEHRVVSANWSTETDAWTLEVLVGPPEREERRRYRCGMLLMCSGYYRYSAGYTPDFPGRERFQGPIIHPQDWPETLDYKEKEVVVIGSGATAVTLIPNMAPDVKHITMLQRSPTYIAAMPDTDLFANLLQKILPAQTAYNLTRRKNIFISRYIYRRTRSHPDRVKKRLVSLVKKALGPDYDVDRHFTPHYNPWDQRLCLVPNGDLFEAINSGKASVVTDQIDSFTEDGILLKSGNQLPADIIITATGLQLLVLGGVKFSLDGRPIDFADTYTYLGMMNSGIPNLISTFGYVNASWTLRADLIADYTCRLINHMDGVGATVATPTLRPEELEMEKRPYVADFSAGYIQRMLSEMPKQGDRQPWLYIQDYLTEKRMFEGRAVDDGVIIFKKMAVSGEKIAL